MVVLEGEIGMWYVLGGVLTASSMLRECSSSDCVSWLKIESVSACDCVSGSLSTSVSLSDSCFGLKVLYVCECRVEHLLSCWCDVVTYAAWAKGFYLDSCMVCLG